MDPASNDLTGQTLGSQFQITRQIGEGGMGQVYLAHQLDMDRDVVIKVMHPELTVGSPEAVARFKREARAVARLNHPHIVQVYVFGQTDAGLLYLAMEYIEGRSLTDSLEQMDRMPEPQALRIMDQVCSALSEAHGNGLVHRDLKPDNIMLAERHGNPDYVKVLDFGIAKMMGPEDAAMTQAGSVFGTPQYMSPEQATGTEVDARTDIYALGCILYEMLTGAHPFHADTAMGFLVQHMTEAVVPPITRFPEAGLSPRAQAIVMRCLEKDPGSRFQSAAELQHEIRVALQEKPASVRGFPTSPQRAPLDGSADTVAGAPAVAPVASAMAAGQSGVAPASSSGGLPLLVLAGAAIVLVLGLGAAGVAYLFFGGEDELTQAGPGGPLAQGSPAYPSGGAESKPPAPGEPSSAGQPPPAPQAGAAPDEVFGAPVPPGAELYMRTPDTAIFHVPGSPEPVMAFYRARFSADTEITLIQTQAAGGPYMVVNAEGADRPYQTIAVMVTPSSIRPGGPSLQVTIQKAP